VTILVVDDLRFKPAIFLRVILWFLLGVLAKPGCRTWFFDGDFVVDSW
jgi:hypothetical protein